MAQIAANLQRIKNGPTPLCNYTLRVPAGFIQPEQLQNIST